jgi:uncharacterized OsmC-like protein
MTDQAHIKQAFERSIKALEQRPFLGQGTAVTHARLRDGLTCDVEEGPWKLVVDMSEKAGGANAGPNPGVLGRGALASCLAICYARWAALRDIPLTALDVEVQADYDARGENGVSNDVYPGYSEIRYVVTIESAAPEADVMQMLDDADRYSSYHDVFRRAVDLRREVKLVAPAGE